MFCYKENRSARGFSCSFIITHWPEAQPPGRAASPALALPGRGTCPGHPVLQTVGCSPPHPPAVAMEAALLLRPLEVTVPQEAAPWLWEPVEWTLPHVSSQRMAGLPSLQVESGRFLEVDSSVALREGGSLLCAWV